MPFLLTAAAALRAVFVKGWVAGVEVLRVESILRDPESIAEALIVYYLALAKEFDDIVDIGVVGKTENVVIGHSRLLLGGEVLI